MPEPMEQFNNPRATVLMSVYNGEKYLREAIDSILAQTFADFEFLIVNDASTDSTREIVLSYHDSRIVLIDNEVNLGLTKSLNNGLRMARGKLIARMDADDVSLPERLKSQVDVLESKKEIVAVGTGCVEIDESGSEINRTKIVKLLPEHVYLRLFFNNTIAHSSVMFVKEAVMEIGGYDEFYQKAQDYDLWSRLSMSGLFLRLSVPLIKRRVTLDNQRRNYTDEQADFALRRARQNLANLGVTVSDTQLIAWREWRSSWKDLPMLAWVLFLAAGHAPRQYRKRHLASSIFLMLGYFFINGLRSRVNNVYKSTDLAIVVLFYEKLEQTKECIASLYDTRARFYVLNNGSSVESAGELKAFCSEKYPAVQMLDSTENLGVSGGRNFLIKNTTSDWLVFVDNDITTQNHAWFDIFSNYIAKHPNIEAFVPRVYNVQERDYSLYVPLLVRNGELKRSYNFFKKEINFFPGGASCVSRKLFDRLGMYDEEMFVGFEDFEFSLRGLKSGQPIKALKIADLVLKHDHRPVVTDEDKRAVRVRYSEERQLQSYQRMKTKHGVKFTDDWTKWLVGQREQLLGGRVDKFRVGLRWLIKRVIAFISY